MIISKQKATLAIAIALAMDHAVKDCVTQNKISRTHFQEFIKKLREKTLYKNIWIQIIDTQGYPVYESYYSKHEDNLKKVRQDITLLLKKPQILTSISLGYHDLTFNSMVPIYDKGKFIAILAIASHFNSIARLLKENGVESIVIANKEASNHLNHPFRDLFVNGRYVANENADKTILKFLKDNGIENYIQKKYTITDKYLIINYPLQNIKQKTIANYLMFVPMEKIKQRYVYPIMKKNTILTSIAILLFLSMVGIFFHFNDNRLKKYYRRILDSASNIIIITDGEKLLDVNKVFFKYFNRVTSLKEFREKYKTLCDLFIEEKGYLQKNMNNQRWLTYLITHPENEEKVKINYEGKIYYFLISAKPLTEDNTQYSIVMVDTTKEEEYKQKLLQESITDPLTRCYNRRYFETKSKEELLAAKRYHYPLSLIMFDIDFFKNINDTYGHDIGDLILKNLALHIKKIIRQNDICFRIGGEEFIIILPHTDQQESFELAQRIRREIMQKELVKDISITLSLGVITLLEDETIQQAYKRVDTALYAAKQNGRDQVQKG